jgi:hypothetical protein
VVHAKDFTIVTGHRQLAIGCQSDCARKRPVGKCGWAT